MSDGSRITPGELELEPAVRVGAATPLADAARILTSTGLDTLLVDTVPLTEVTEHDVVRAVAAGLGPDTAVIDVVHETPLFVDHHTTLDRIVQAMLREHRRSVVVVDGAGHVLGMLTLAVAIAAVVEGPPWLGALRVALGIEEPAP